MKWGSFWKKRGLFIGIISVLAIHITLFAIFTPFLLNILFRPNFIPLMPPQTTKINSITWDENTGQNRVIAEYTGNKTVTLIEVYSNEKLDPDAIIGNQLLSQNQKTEISLSEKYSNTPNRITIRIATLDGFSDFYQTKIFYEIGLKQIAWDKKNKQNPSRNNNIRTQLTSSKTK